MKTINKLTAEVYDQRRQTLFEAGLKVTFNTEVVAEDNASKEREVITCNLLRQKNSTDVTGYDLIDFGTSVKHPSDPPNKKLGRQIAYFRAIENALSNGSINSQEADLLKSNAPIRLMR